VAEECGRLARCDPASRAGSLLVDTVAGRGTLGDGVRDARTPNEKRGLWARVSDSGSVIRDLLRGCLDLVQTGLGALDDCAEGGGVADGDVGQHLAVKRTAGGLQAGDEL
jgi:hypothetical protein